MMGVNYNFYIVDDHLGLLDGRTCEAEAKHIQDLLEKANFIIFRKPVFVPEGNCICFELRNCIPDHIKSILSYDGIFYKREGSSEIEKLG